MKMRGREEEEVVDGTRSKRTRWWREEVVAPVAVADVATAVAVAVRGRSMACASCWQVAHTHTHACHAPFLAHARSLWKLTAASWALAIRAHASDAAHVALERRCGIGAGQPDLEHVVVDRAAAAAAAAGAAAARRLRRLL